MAQKCPKCDRGKCVFIFWGVRDLHWISGSFFAVILLTTFAPIVDRLAILGYGLIPVFVYKLVTSRWGAIWCRYCNASWHGYDTDRPTFKQETGTGFVWVTVLSGLFVVVVMWAKLKNNRETQSSFEIKYAGNVAQVRLTGSALQFYKSMLRPPQNLTELLEYMKIEESPIDDWGNTFIYEHGDPCRIRSAGPDQIPNTRDDVVSTVALRSR